MYFVISYNCKDLNKHMRLWNLLLTIMVAIGLLSASVEAKTAKKVVPAKKPVTKAKKGKTAHED